MRAKNYFVYRDWELNRDEFLVKSFYLYEMERMFYEICRTIGFSDCTDIEIDEIVYNGRPVRYCGWMPGMRMKFVFADTDYEEVVWDRCYPEWDH